MTGARPTRIAISTGGGDAPGLNAVIRAISRSAFNRGYEVFGSPHGLEGLLDPSVLRKLEPADIRGILHTGGTILGAASQGNPFAFPVRHGDHVEVVDRADEVVANFRAMDLDALVMIGGDGTLTLAHHLSEKGVPIVGVPKTIDNDVVGTVATFGFETAVAVATEALDRLHTTAESHCRVMVVEVMGRNSGFIALFAGIAGGADIILIPEIPFDPTRVAAKVEQRYAIGRNFAIVVVAEGASPLGREPLTRKDSGGGIHLGGIAEWVAQDIAQRTGRVTRHVVLGHVQRGGSPTVLDRLLGTRFGAAAVRLIEQQEFGRVVVYDPPEIKSIPLAAVAGRTRQVDLRSDAVLAARDLGVSLGD